MLGQAICRTRLALTLSQRIGPASLAKLEFAYPDLNDIFKASKSDFRARCLHQNLYEAMQNINWQDADASLEWAEQAGHHIIDNRSLLYPKQLTEIASCPSFLFVKGDLNLLTGAQIAIVGSRNPTHMGSEHAYEFAQALVENNFIITSGLAIGIDSEAHLGALAANGKTIAVLGTGLNQIYPKRNIALAERISESGALVSEFPLEMKAQAKNFPRRNRIISGLSLGVLVPEATLRSGSLITANYALEQGREIFAIPGSIHNPLAKGCHHLLRQGACLVEKTSDLLHELTGQQNPVQNPHTQQLCFDQLAKDYQILVKCVGYEATTVDTLVKRSKLSTEKVLNMLTELEVLGVICASPGGYVRKTNERNLN